MDATYLDFCPKLRKMMESGKSLDLSGNVVQIGGISTLNNIRIIRELILRGRPSRTLEIGLAFGGSALAFLATLKEVSVDGFHHSAIDPFQSKGWGGSAVRAISDCGFSGNFTLHEDYSSHVLPELCRSNEQFDIIYIDGSHVFEDAFIDFYYALRVLRLGGIMLFDDCCDPHVCKVIKFIRTNYGQILNEIDYRVLENPHKSLKKRVGNLLGVRQLCGFTKKGEPPRDWNVPFVNF